MRRLLFCLAILLFSRAALAQLSPTHGDLVYATVVGSDRQPLDLHLDLYLPPVSAQPRPVVLWIHGGGWVGGSKFPCPAAPLSLSGYAVASVQYRLSGEATWPAQIHDCKAAVRWLRAHAAEFGLDPDRMGAFGSSAGGHLSAFLGTSGGLRDVRVGDFAIDLEGQVGDHLDRSSRVQAVVDFFGPTDPLSMSLFPSGLDHDDALSPESLLIGGPIQDLPEVANSVDPALWLSPDDAPMLIVHGSADNSVPYTQSEALWRRATEEHGLPFELVAIPDAGHGGPGFSNQFAEAWFDEQLASASTRVRIQATSSPAEGGPLALFTITRSGPLAAPLTVLLATSGSAQAGQDFLSPPQRVVIPAGSANRNVPVPLINDALVEGPESLNVELVPSPAYLIDNNAAELRWTIADDELGAGLPLVRAETLARVAREDGSADALVRVTRQGAVSSPLSVPYEIRGRARPGIDHDRISGQVSFPSGVAAVDLPIAALDDDFAEPDEYWLLELRAGANHRLDAASVASGEVEDDDRLSGLPLVAVQTERASAAEAGGALVFDLTRTGETSAPLVVSLQWSGSALAGSDYSQPSLSATFAAGNAFARLSLTGLPDSLAEGTEDLRLEVLPSAAFGLTALSQRNGLWLDDDALPLPGEPVEQVLSALTLGREFALDLATLPGSLCLVAVSGARAYLPLGDRPVFLDPLTLSLLGTPTSTPDGSARLRLPVPNQPLWIGTTLFFQSFAVDPQGTLHASALATRALRTAP
jgi:acetyl esterase/lipase